MIDPFQLFESPEIYKVAMLYFSSSRGLAIVGRKASKNQVEVLKIAGEVDPSTGAFVALDYEGYSGDEQSKIITKQAFEDLVSFIEAKIGEEIRMSVIEPAMIRSLEFDYSKGPFDSVLH